MAWGGFFEALSLEAKNVDWKTDFSEEQFRTAERLGLKETKGWFYSKFLGHAITEHYFADSYGKAQGPFKSYYKDGQLCVKCTYRDGKEDGPYEQYHDNGQVYKKCTYKDGKIVDGPYEMYWDNGQLYIKCTYKDGEYDGPYESYYDNGQLMQKCTYRDGKLDGSYERYYDDGQVKKRGACIDGKFIAGEAAYQKAVKAQESKKVDMAVLSTRNGGR